MAEERTTVDLVVDGVRQSVTVRGDETLLETVRDQCGVTSARYSCGIGVCGTCTVLLDGEAVSSCLLLTQMVQDTPVTTAEGVRTDDGGVPAALDAFVEAGAYQCSYCIPAMALTVHSALERDPDASVEQLCDELGGVLCRCGSYPQVRAAVEALVSARINDSVEERE